MRKVLYAILAVLLLVLIASAILFVSARPKPNPKPARPTAQLALSEDDFDTRQAHRTNEIPAIVGHPLIVDLGSNVTTGYMWEEQPANSDPTVLKQSGSEYISNPPPQPGWVGHGGIQTWSFEPLKPGTSTLQFVYRHGSGTEAARRTLKLIVTVK
ncbi:MAG TPA: protease inhibitor I42 family protein [Roseimicrobium sp.]|nr:protease inhibitor I42 family protein [Roseimicrobium sp.]